MNVSIAPGASLRRIAQIARNAILFGPDAWDNGSVPEQNLPAKQPGVLPSDRDLADLFCLLAERHIPYLLVGGVAMLRYVEGRNTEDIDLLMSLPSIERLPEIFIKDRNDCFLRGLFRTVRVDILLTSNALFEDVRESCATTHRFAEIEVPTATPEGLILLKLFALPSLYPQGQFERVSIYEGDIASLIQRHRPAIEPLLKRLEPHLAESDQRELHGIIRDIQARIARFEQLNKS